MINVAAGFSLRYIMCSKWKYAD